MRRRESSDDVGAELGTDEIGRGLDAVGVELEPWQVDAVRAIAREEVASLCGLVLRRSQNKGGLLTRVELASVFGEALKDFTTEDEPGDDEPGAA